MNRHRQLRLWLAHLNRYEQQLRVKISRARTSFLLSVSSAYEGAHGTVPGYIFEGHKRIIQGILGDHYSTVAPAFGALVLKQIKSRTFEQKQAQSFFASFMREWIATEALRKATMIASTDMNDVRDAIQNGVEAGDGVEAIARAIRGVSSLTPFRAATVARTETHNAATFGSIETAKASEQEYEVKLLKVWLPTVDDRTRPEHLAMERHPPIPLNEQFDVGGENMDRPGDPSGSAENVINCRCALAYEESIQ